MPLDNVPTAVGMIYGFAALAISILLVKKGKLIRKAGTAILFATAAVGFLLFAPMLPLQFVTLLTQNTAAIDAPVPLVLAISALFIVLTLVFGRLFCGYVCPIGAVQELAYNVPTRKLKAANKTINLLIHTVSALAIMALAIILGVNVMTLLGVPAFFNLQIFTIAFLVFVIILVVSVFLYRPFCSFLCPYGLFLAIAARFSLFKLERTDDCIDCGLCEKACPTGEAGRKDTGQECYHCSRCVAACPKDAIKYMRRKTKE